MQLTFDLPSEDPTLARALRAAVDAKTKPPGSLGRLESLAVQLGTVQGTRAPSVNAPAVCVIGADHGAAVDGLSAYPQAVTRQMVLNFLAGGAAINALAGSAGVQLLVVDAGVLEPIGDVAGLVQRRIGAGTRNYLHEAAMSEAQLEQAIDSGRALAAGLADAGCNVIGLGEMGIGNTASAALLMSLLLDLPVDECVGAGTGLDAAGVEHKARRLEHARSRILAEVATPDAAQLLRQAGGFEIAMLAGVALGAAQRRALVLVDGFITSAAVLAASRLNPALLDFCVFSHCSAERGHARLLESMRAEPLLDLGLRLGEGTGAALAVPMLRAAAAFVNEMATFESAAVSGAVPDRGAA